jgi:hypothetical protein
VLVMKWDDVPSPGEEARLSPSARSALETLMSACDTDAPASLLAAHMTLSCSGRLQSATAKGVVVELSCAPPEPLLVGAACAVSFPLAGRNAAFTGRVTLVADGPRGACRVTLELPQRIRYDEQRASVRVPVVEGTLGCALLKGESLQQVKPIDISLRGILIEFRGPNVPDIQEGHRRMIALKLGERKVLLEAEVRRRDGARYGMRFILRDKPPRELIRIITELAATWSATKPAP